MRGQKTSHFTVEVTMKRLMVVLALLATSFPLRADAQSGDAGLRGYVTDEQGGILPGVTVTAAGPAIMTPASAVTDSAGYYRLVSLPPGTYVISAELTGFSTQRHEGVVVGAGNKFQVELGIGSGRVSEYITRAG